MDDRGIPKPWLLVCLRNPLSGKEFYTFGLIDTGSEGCAIPETYAKFIGHNFENGESCDCISANSKSKGFYHSIDIDFLDMDYQLIYKIQNKQVHCVRNLNIVLLGVKDFLDHSILHIDFPKELFTLKFLK